MTIQQQQQQQYEAEVARLDHSWLFKDVLNTTQGATDAKIAVITLLGENKTETFPWGTRKCEHRINPITIAALNNALDLVEHDVQVAAVVVTAQGHFFCNGIDLQWIDANPSKANELQRDAELLLARILCFPVPTFAAIQGHFCAAGTMLGLAFDYRIMAKGRALCFVPAVDLGLVYSPGMTELMKSKTPMHMHRDMILFGKRYGAEDLLENKVVEEICDKDELLRRTFEHVASLLAGASSSQGVRFLGAKYRSALHGIKKNTFRTAYEGLRIHVENPNQMQGMGFENGEWDESGRAKL